MSKRKPRLAPRNGHVAAMRLRKSGSHGKTMKAQRRADTIQFKKSIRDIQTSGPAAVSLSAWGAQISEFGKMAELVEGAGL
ncbi:hypothetical protein [Salipiger sp. PrR003]|uniref:hypothetical protein n=1 Tax=Salipiger sp. PrR003 TaxID=2706776 RepID=UPI0013DCB653|nr:hypothetical protein [Salipiger sp. PrR003]NDV51533.1 hypothetical protein [Salipiger sp. PrR003]